MSVISDAGHDNWEAVLLSDHVTSPTAVVIRPFVLSAPITGDTDKESTGSSHLASGAGGVGSSFRSTGPVYSNSELAGVPGK